MKNYIINSFILKDKNTLNDLYNYIKFRYNKTVNINDIKIELTNLIKKNIIFLDNNNYNLTNEGNIILNDNIYYYSRIIVNFFRKYSKIHKIYELKEKRLEQKRLRIFLINNKKHICIICDKTLPLCLLETAHLKPRCRLNNNELNDKHIVEFMCRYCHTLYDNGLISVYNGLVEVSKLLNNYDLNYNNKLIYSYNLQNEKYFMFHYTYIYKNKILN
jgi:hypothetical protein